MEVDGRGAMEESKAFGLERDRVTVQGRADRAVRRVGEVVSEPLERRGFVQRTRKSERWFFGVFDGVYHCQSFLNFLAFCPSKCLVGPLGSAVGFRALRNA